MGDDGRTGAGSEVEKRPILGLSGEVSVLMATREIGLRAYFLFFLSFFLSFRGEEMIKTVFMY